MNREALGCLSDKKVNDFKYIYFFSLRAKINVVGCLWISGCVFSKGGNVEEVSMTFMEYYTP